LAITPGLHIRAEFQRGGRDVRFEDVVFFEDFLVFDVPPACEPVASFEVAGAVLEATYMLSTRLG
jgi:hypothetical protein